MHFRLLIWLHFRITQEFVFLPLDLRTPNSVYAMAEYLVWYQVLVANFVYVDVRIVVLVQFVWLAIVDICALRVNTLSYWQNLSSICHSIVMVFEYAALQLFFQAIFRPNPTALPFVKLISANKEKMKKLISLFFVFLFYFAWKSKGNATFFADIVNSKTHQRVFI